MRPRRSPRGLAERTTWAERIVDRRVLRARPRAVRTGAWPRSQVDLPRDPFTRDPTAEGTAHTGVTTSRTPATHRESTTSERRPAPARHRPPESAPVHPPAADGSAPAATGSHSGSGAGPAPPPAGETLPPPAAVAWGGLATATELPGLDVRTFVVADDGTLGATLDAVPATGPTAEPGRRDRPVAAPLRTRRPTGPDGTERHQPHDHATPVPATAPPLHDNSRTPTAPHSPDPSPPGSPPEHPGPPRRHQWSTPDAVRWSDSSAAARRPGRERPVISDGASARTVPGTGESVTTRRAADRPSSADDDSRAAAGPPRVDQPQRTELDPSELTRLADAVARRLRDREVLDRARRGEVPWQR